MKRATTIGFMWILAGVPLLALAGEEGMPGMPVLKPKRVYEAKAGEDWAARQGFGEDEGTVRMMNLMMVEGSGLEGMDMSGAHGHEAHVARHAPAPGDETRTNPSPFQVEATLTPNPPRVGSNRLEFSLLDPSSGKRVSGLVIHAQVFMTTMDMGTEQPPVKEVAPGRYRVEPSFSMKGAWAVRLRSDPRGPKEGSARAWETLLTFDVGGKRTWKAEEAEPR